MINKKLYLISIVLFLLFGHFVQAVGVGVKPKEIDLSVKVGKGVVTEFLVSNIAEEPALYQVYPDDLVDKIKLEPTDFQLDPGGSQIVKTAVKINSPGKFNTNISIIARPLAAGGLVTAPGVKVPITITVVGIPLWWLALGLLLIFVVCSIVIFTVRYRHKKPVHNLTDNRTRI